MSEESQSSRWSYSIWKLSSAAFLWGQSVSLIIHVWESRLVPEDFSSGLENKFNNAQQGVSGCNSHASNNPSYCTSLLTVVFLLHVWSRLEFFGLGGGGRRKDNMMNKRIRRERLVTRKTSWSGKCHSFVQTLLAQIQVFAAARRIWACETLWVKHDLDEREEAPRWSADCCHTDFIVCFALSPACS